MNSEQAAGQWDFITHLDTRHLRWSKTFASLIAFCQGRDELFPPDLVSGTYVANFDRVVALWPEPAVLEDFIAEKCKWSEPRWLTWQRWQYEFEHAPRNLHIPFTSSFITLHRQKRFVGKRFKNSKELKELFSLAEKISPHKADFQGRSLPLLTDEIMLLAATRSEHPIGKALVESGLDTRKLEERALRQVENPEDLRF
jgi:hypothetical protein